MLIPNKTYSFTTIDPVELGGDYKSMKVVGIMSHGEAYKYRDIYTLHEKLSRRLTQKIQIEDMVFYLFETLNGQKLLLPDEYLVQDSIHEVTQIKIIIEVPDAKTGDISVLNEALTGLGFYGCNIRSVEV